MLLRRRVAVHHQRAAEAALPVEEARGDPGPARIGAGGPGRRQESRLVAIRPSSPPWTNTVLPSRRCGRWVSSRSTICWPRAAARQLVARRRRAGRVRRRASRPAPCCRRCARPATWRRPSRRAAAAHRQQHEDLVVADDAVDPIDAARLGVLGPEPQHAQVVGPAIDHVAEIDQPARRVAFAGKIRTVSSRLAQLLGAAMHVADREHGLALERERSGFPGRDLDGRRPLRRRC